jgi:hypothetical protein
MAQLQTRAVYDLGCPAPQVAVYHLDTRTKAAVGCGRRLLYVESCQRIRGKHECTWVLDTPTFAQAQWPQLYAPRGAPTYVLMGPAQAGTRPLATTLFDGRAPAPPGPTPPAPGGQGPAAPPPAASYAPAGTAPSGAPPGPAAGVPWLGPSAAPVAPTVAPAPTAAPTGPPATSGGLPPGPAPVPSGSLGPRDRAAPPPNDDRGRIISTDLSEMPSLGGKR